MMSLHDDALMHITWLEPAQSWLELETEEAGLEVGVSLVCGCAAIS